MIADLKPYPEYKESGLPWLGKLPKNWDSRRMKFLFNERSKKGFPDEPLLAATQSKGVVKKEDYGFRTVTATNGLENLKLVEIGDFVISLRSFQGGIEVSHARGIISPAYTVLRPQSGYNAQYYKSYFKSSVFIGSLPLYVTGIREGQNIDYERLSRSFLPLPPPSEQAAIVRFLDWSNSRLDRAIKAKRKIIALLNEQKQAIIYRAVTCGLDPSVCLKDSGIPWLGKIPEHWEAVKVKNLVKTYGGMTPNKGIGRYWAGRMPWISPKDMKVPEIFTSVDHISDAAIRETNIPIISIDAVLIVVRGMILARIFPTAITRVPVAINQDMKALMPTQKLSVEYLSFVLTGIQHHLLDLVEISGHGTCCLRTDSWSVFHLPVPPLVEQHEIVQFLTNELTVLNNEISRLEREIDLLREYRTRLVADVVTGKLDVQEAAAGLPDEATSGSVEDEDDLGDEDEAADEEVEA